MPSDEEVRTPLANNPHLMDQPEVHDLLRAHPEWDPRTTSSDSPAPAPAETATDEPAETATDEPTEAPASEQTADTAEETSSPRD